MKRSSDPSQAIDVQKDKRLIERLRVLFVLCVFLGVVDFISVVTITVQIVVYAAFRQQWQAYVVAGVQLCAVLTVAAAAWQSRRGHYSAALSLILAGLLLMILPASLLVNNGLPLGLAVFACAIWLAVRVVPDRWASWTVIFGLALGGLLIALQLYPPVFQTAAPGGGRYTLVLSALVFLVTVGYVLWQFKQLPLALKFVLIFLGITILGVGAVALYTQNSTRRALTDSVGQGLVNLTATQAQATGDLLQQQINAMQALSLGELLQFTVAKANDTYPATLTEIRASLISQDQDWRRKAAAGDLNDPFIFSRLNNVIAQDLIEFSHTFPDHVELLLTDRYGGLVAANELTSDFYQADEEWWLRAYNDKQGAIYVSPSPEYDESAGTYSILISLPVFDRQSGELIGVLRTTYRIDALIELVQGGRFGQTGKFDMYFSGYPVQRVHADGLDQAPPETLQTVQDTAQGVYAEVGYDGTPSLVSQSLVHSTRPNPAIEKLAWRIVAHQETKEAYAPVEEQVRSLLLLSLAVVGLVSVGAIFLAQVLAAPIQRLTATAVQVREGNLNTQARVDSRDEIGVLAGTFNEMTARLRQTIGGLEQTVAERTRELTLAGAVGRTLSEVRDPEQLLRTAVELIRSSFDLYYTQIYLVDASGRNLMLRAGSGQVGAELLRRGHRLAIGPGSINGRAASEREAVIVEDTQQSEFFRPNPMLPDTRSEMAVPLSVGERVVGVLDMQSTRPGVLSEVKLPAFQALAGQLAVAVDNASLFEQTQQARAEVELQARRLTREGWVDYLNAIERSERIGYVWDAGKLERTGDMKLEFGQQGEDAAANSVLAVPIEVIGEPVGSIQLAGDPGRPWSEGDRELVAAVAAQVSRQVDNLRLLDQAERYRLDAEVAARRLTRAGWEEYLGSASGKEIGFVYAGGQVLPEDAARSTAGQPVEPGETVRQPLEVRGETVGELILEGEKPLGEEDLAILKTVAERLSGHLDGLRLAAQTQAALSTTEALFTGSEQVVRSGSAEQVLRAVAESTALHRFTRCSILVFNHPWIEQMPAGAHLAAEWRKDDTVLTVPLGTFYDFKIYRFAEAIGNERAMIVGDVINDPRLDEATRQLFTRFGNAIVFIPLVAGEQCIGWLTATAPQAVHLSDEEIRQAVSLAGQAASVVQGIRLLEQAETRARREQVLRQVAERVRSAVDPEQVLRIAAREVGEALGRNVLVRLGGTPDRDRDTTAGNGDGKTAG